MQERNPNGSSKKNHKFNLNIGLLIFLFVFVQLLIAIVSSFHSKSISPYQVKVGSLYTNTTYQGIALRKEKVYYGSEAGYVNYYVREGTHIAVGDLVYTVDETGRMNEQVAASDGELSLSDSDLAEIRSDISNFSSAFTPTDFYQVYSFKSSLNSRVVELATIDTLASVDSIGNNGSSLVHYHYSDCQGVLTYNVDGYEALKLQDMNSSLFKQDDYECSHFSNNDLIKSGDMVYKICSDEDWSIVIPVDENTANLLTEKEYVEVKFKKNGYTSWGACKSYQNADGDWYVELSFTNSMITFSTERFVNIELLLDNESGLKIPLSSIVKREFFIVPKEYTVDSGKDGKRGVLKERFNDEGNQETVVVEATIYGETDSSYYLDGDDLENNDYILKPEDENGEKYQLGLTGSKDGVYNINKGYAEFREINIKNQNDEYAIVEPNLKYGLSVYDYIALDSSAVETDDLIYE